MSNSLSGVQRNSKGYLVDFNAWDKNIAIELAKESGLELTDCHWIIINFLRDYYSEYGIAPDAREIIHKIGKKIYPDIECKRKDLEKLFANGGCKLACQIAGLPNCPCRGV